MRNNYFFIVVLFSCFSLAQDSLSGDKVNINFSGYIDGYYAYDFSNSNQLAKQSFFYNHNRHNEFNINLALVSAFVSYQNIYAKLSFHGGTYVDDNYSNENIKNINEAYMGVYLDNAKKSTIEFGIFSSYIGFESAITGSNLTLTRSILAENSPYFMTGVRYNYKPSAKWMFSGMLSNGWQRISKQDKRVAPAIGTQIIFKPADNSTFNWSTFFGKEFYGTHLGMRYFSNLYWDKSWNSKWRTILGYDFGIQETRFKDNKFNHWMSPVLIAQYTINDKWQSAVRFEYYQDKENITTSSPFNTKGYSLNFDYHINSKAKFRMEARYLDSKEAIFYNNNSNNFSFTTSMSYEFN
jgi:hypothetical protein